MKKVILNVPDNREREFSEKLAELMKEYGVTERYEPREGDFVAFMDDTTDEPFIGIFCSWYNDEADKIVCYAHIDDEGSLEQEEEYWNADTIRKATKEEKDNLLRELAKSGKRWNAEEKTFDECQTYEAIRTFEDAMTVTGMTLPLSDETLSLLGADIVAYMKLRVIVAAINGLSETTLAEFPKFTTDEYRYYPWFALYTKEEIEAMDEEDKWRVVGRALLSASADGGCVFAYANYASSCSYTLHGARLAFIDRERAKYAGRQFAELYADFLFLPLELIAE
jgi:hypothetical protein